jgi:hypothetical protein
MSKTYIANEFIVVAPFPLGEDSLKENGQIMLKLHSERGETKWLNVTPEQVSMIEKILLDVPTRYWKESV